jgi:hypothetical protein
MAGTPEAVDMLLVPDRRAVAPLTMAVTLAATLAATTGVARAQGCESVSSQVSLAAFAGRRIAAVHVVTADPSPLPGPAAPLTAIHVRTRAAAVRRELLFTAGDTIDTLRVAESLRRLRRLRFLTEADVRATSCGGPVSLTVVTRDGWSTKPNVQVGGSSAAFSLRERNLLGTGRQAEVSLRSDRGRIGFGASLRDPAALGDRATLSLGGRRYTDGSEWSVALARREQSVLDPWGVEAYFDRSTRTPVADVAAASAAGVPTAVALALPRVDFRRARGGALAERLVHASGIAALALQAGLAYERAGLVASPTAPLVGANGIRRQVVAAEAGVRRRSVAFDTLTWLLPGGAIVDVPRALEFDALLGVGRELAGGTPIAHLDVWGGRMWRPTPGSMLVGDLWASGFRTPQRVSVGVLRGSVAYDRAARRGVWSARLGAEWLREPDPDLSAMVTSDPTAAALSPDKRLAEAVVALSVERAVRLRPLTRSWSLDAAASGGLSTRWDPAVASPYPGLRLSHPESAERLDLAVVGVGLRLMPTRAGRAAARLDVGYPLLHPGGTRGRPFIAVSVSPWLEAGRHRDGRVDP